VSAAPTPLAILRRPGLRPFPPRVSTFTRPFWDGLAEGRLVTTGCARCGRLSFPPRPVCRGCWSDEPEWRELRPHGVLYSYTRVHVVPRAFLADGLYVIGIVDLADGVRLMCRLMGEVSDYAPDMPVEMVVPLYDDGPLFAARPLSEASGGAKG